MGKEIIFEDVFEGSNTKMLAVKVSSELFEILGETALEANVTMPELVRALLGLSVIPRVLKTKIDKGLVLDAKDMDHLTAFKTYVGRLEEMAREAKKFERKVLKLKKEADWLTHLVEKKIDTVMDRIRKESKGGTK